MALTVKYFASLREQAGLAERQLAYEPGMTAAAAWAASMPGVPLSSRILVAVNREYAGHDTLLADGDEVAYFPAVTGG